MSPAAPTCCAGSAATVMAAPEIFGRNDAPRPGGLFDHLAALAQDGTIAAPVILSELLKHLGPIWPSRLTLGGVALGDCWKHSALTDATMRRTGLVPLHKLSQWLAYSLIEPLQWAASRSPTSMDSPASRNTATAGCSSTPACWRCATRPPSQRQHTVDSELVVEWRALTVALLDRLADVVRARLKMDRETLPLARILQGGTWAAGRNVARQLRPDGGPPLKIVSDGTVF